MIAIMQRLSSTSTFGDFCDRTKSWWSVRPHCAPKTRSSRPISVASPASYRYAATCNMHLHCLCGSKTGRCMEVTIPTVTLVGCFTEQRRQVCSGAQEGAGGAAAAGPQVAGAWAAGAVHAHEYEEPAPP